MNINQNESSASLILLDIEGATTPIDFVYKTLFPFARARVGDYLARNWDAPEVQAHLAQLRDEGSADISQGLNPPNPAAPAAIEGESASEQIERAVAYIHWLMDRDRKSTPLKAIQGKIWQEGYQAGELLSEVFDDVPPAFARWRRRNKLICIYSSGSELAQKLLFAHTTAGDLTDYIYRYFDTTIGHKIEEESYRRIAEELRLSPTEILFISDVIAELDAARAAGMKTILAIRPGNRPVEDRVNHPAVDSFASL
ncbi:MAG: acireductone synthase [Chloracidobacterium sp.]|nr:acireductone synthase [Chloracidobacterium sp.]